MKREVTRWSSHSEAMLQAALDDVDWDMFRASSSDVSEFTDVAVSFVNTLTEQATETITVRTFPNQKPWVDRTIRAAVNKRTTRLFCLGIWAGTKHRAMLSVAHSFIFYILFFISYFLFISFYVYFLVLYSIIFALSMERT